MKPSVILIYSLIACSFSIEKKDIDILYLQKEYKLGHPISFSLESNSDRKIYFYFEGFCFGYNGEFSWRGFDNDILSKVELKQESNLWLESKNKLDFNINPYNFLKKFSYPPDSFKIRIVYRYENIDGDTAKFIYSESFRISK